MTTPEESAEFWERSEPVTFGAHADRDASEQPKPKWADLFGAAPGLTDTTTAGEFAAVERERDALRATVARVEALRVVAEERARQDAKWGQQDHPDGTGPTIPSLNAAEFAQHECDYAFRHGVGTWRHVLDEEVAEAFAESEPEKLRHELIQVAAVAAAWVEAIDRRAALDGGGAS